MATFVFAGARGVTAQDVPERVNVEGLGRLPAFSHASVVGDTIYVSGTLGTKAGTTELVEGGMGPETAATLANIEQILEAFGANRRHIVKCTVFINDMDQFPMMNEAYIAFFGDEPPARTTVEVSRLALGAALEIDAIAALPEGFDTTTLASEPDGSDDFADHVMDALLGSTMAQMPEMGDPEHLPAVPETGFFESDGESIYYEATGEGEPVVLSHGLGGNHAIWFQQVPILGQTHKVITWDQRGFGRSTNKAGEAGPEAFARDLAALLDHLEIERAHLIGQSMGGWTVVGFAVANPERVRSMVLADSIGGIYNEEIAASFDAFIRERMAGPQEDAPSHLAAHPALGDMIAEMNPAKAFLYRQITSLAPAPPRPIAGLLRSTAYPLEDIAKFDFPVLVVAGSDDPIFPPDTLRAVQHLIPGAQFVEIRVSGHSPYFENPRAWNREVADFLRRASD